MKLLTFLFIALCSTSSLQAMGGCGGGIFKEAERLEMLAEKAKKAGNGAREKALRRMAEIQRHAAINGEKSVDWAEYKKLQKKVFPPVNAKP